MADIVVGTTRYGSEGTPLSAEDPGGVGMRVYWVMIDDIVIDSRLGLLSVDYHAGEGPHTVTLKLMASSFGTADARGGPE